jgi:regulator of RNase E activity RraA
MKDEVSLYREVKIQEISDEEKRELLELCTKIKALSGGTASCSDALDRLGYRGCAMNSDIKPYFPEKGRMCGIAYALKGVNITGMISETVKENVDVEYYDNIKPGYVLMFGTARGEKLTVMGDVLGTFSAAKGAVGAVTEGQIRDIERVQALPIHIFGRSASPVSGGGRVLWIEYNCTVQVGDVWIEPFDIVFGDPDGVVVIPKHTAKRVYEIASEICNKEDAMKEDIVNCKDMKLREVFDKYKSKA